MHRTRLFEIERVPIYLIELGKIRCDVSTLEISKQLVNNANALKNMSAEIRKKKLTFCTTSGVPKSLPP